MDNLKKAVFVMITLVIWAGFTYSVKEMTRSFDLALKESLK